MRDIEATALANINSDINAACVMVSLDFPSGVVRLNNGDRNIDFSGDTFQAVGNLGTASVITESRELSSPGVRLTLSGIDPALMASAIADECHNRPVSVYLQYLTDAGEASGDPVLMWSGFMDFMLVNVSDTGLSIEVNCESRLVMAGGFRVLRTQEAHQSRYSGDTFFSQLANLNNVKLEWGGKIISPNPPNTPGINPGAYEVDP